MKNRLATALCFCLSAAVMAGAVAHFFRADATLQFGDAEAHLDIARRVVDSRTPGWSQLGTTWLPLPHLLMIPLVRNDWLWTTGLAGALTSGASIAAASAFLFAATRRIFRSAVVATAAAAVFLLNPNTLYLGSTPMTEPVFFACLFAMLYFTVRFRQTHGWGALIGAAVAACAGTLTRYEGWLLLPFATASIWFSAPRKRWSAAFVFGAIACAGPALWLAHNRWYFGDALFFYRGPWSALAIQGKSPYPGRGDWRTAALYFGAAGRLSAGLPALLIGAAGIGVALARRVIWPVVLCLVPVGFYVWSIHSSGTPVFVPTLWPHSFYNTRYGVAVLPPIAVGVAAFARFGRLAAVAAALVALAPFPIQLAARSGELAITRQEADVNSRARRIWIAKATDFLRTAAGPHETYFTTFGELTPIYRTLGIPLRDTLTGDNDTEWAAAVARPELFLHEDWGIVESGDEAQTVIDRARLRGPRYELSERITVRGAPVIEIYHRVYENPVR